MDITGLPHSKYNARGDISSLPVIFMLVFRLFCKWGIFDDWAEFLFSFNAIAEISKLFLS